VYFISSLNKVRSLADDELFVFILEQSYFISSRVSHVQLDDSGQFIFPKVCKINNQMMSM
jgi:hypothetical protein